MVVLAVLSYLQFERICFEYIYFGNIAGAAAGLAGSQLACYVLLRCFDCLSVVVWSAGWSVACCLAAQHALPAACAQGIVALGPFGIISGPRCLGLKAMVSHVSSCHTCTSNSRSVFFCKANPGPMWDAFNLARPCNGHVHINTLIGNAPNWK